MSNRYYLNLLLLLVAIVPASADEHLGPQKTPVRVGIVGLDAHAVPWTQILTNPATDPAIRRMKIVAAVPAYSPDIPISADNIETNIQAMREMGVEIVDSVEVMLPNVDAVMVLSIDGRKHLEQVRPIFEACKPVFIDKPVAASMADVVRVFDLAKETGTPCFSSSSLRYGPAMVKMLEESDAGRVLGCDVYCSNAPLEPSHPDLFFYGIHGCELLFTIMGPGCQSVSRVKTPTADLAVGVWNDGRLGVFRGILQGQTGFGATVFGDKSIVATGNFEGYETLLREIAGFFESGKPPVSAEQTLEIYAFMEAADASKRQDGKSIPIGKWKR